MQTSIKMIAGSAGSGKALSLDTPVLTPNGWVLNKDLQVGDYVISQDGKPTKVLEVHDNDVLNIYNVEFTDGTSVECCEKHLWTVWNNTLLNQNKEPITLSLKDMLPNIPSLEDQDKYNSIKCIRVSHYYSIPLVEPIQFNNREVPIPPYLLGFLIMKNKLKTSKVTSELVKPLQELGLLECNATTKFIPDIYLYNDVDTRKELLAGLLDCSNVNTLCTSSNVFATNFIELIRGLGGVINTPKKIDNHKIGFSQLPFNPYKDAFKREMFDSFPYKNKRVKKIKSATYIGKKPGRCILVDNSSHLYVVKDYIVTHNTYKLKQEVDTNKLLLTASTGIASVNLSESATTIHSLLRALTGADIVKGIVSGKLFKTYNNIFQDYNGIAIDEAPMLARDYIDALIKSLDVFGDKFNRKLELYLTGDIAQLAPINAEPYFKSIYINRFETEFLTTIYRQTNLEFKEALNDLRIGKTAKIKQLLIDNNCFVNEVQSNFLGLTLFSTKAKVEAYNLARLKGISGYEEFIYRGIKTGKVDSSWNSFLDPVILKVGTLVRCITNHTTEDGNYVANGDMAVVEELYKDIVIINLLRNDKSVAVKRIKKKIVNPETNIEEGTISYMPLKLSFACTIHSIQGITTDKLQVSMGSNDTFMGKCSGMAYVALSRNTTVEKIKVIGNVKDFDKCCYIDPEYLRFINNGMGSK